MRRLLSVLLVLTAVAWSQACGSDRSDRDDDTTPDAGATSDAGSTDAGTTDGGRPDAGRVDAGEVDAGDGNEPDGGFDLDGGFDFDGGSIECAQAGSCTATECDDISGTYVTCVECPFVGKQGPFETVVTRVDTSCEFQATTQQGTNSACATACAGPAGAFSTTISASGFTLTCEGTLVDGSAATTCSPACTLTWLPAGTTACP